MADSKEPQTDEVGSVRHLAGVPHSQVYAQTADLTIKHGNKLLPCHSSALSLHSKVLATMFSDMEKAQWESGVSAVLAEHAFEDVELFLAMAHTASPNFESALKSVAREVDLAEGGDSVAGIARLADQLDAPSIFPAIDDYLLPRLESLPPLVWLSRPEMSFFPRAKAACRKILLKSFLSGPSTHSCMNNISGDTYRYRNYPHKLKDVKRCEQGNWEDLPSDDLCAVLQGVMRALTVIGRDGTGHSFTEEEFAAYLK